MAVRQCVTSPPFVCRILALSVAGQWALAGAEEGSLLIWRWREGCSLQGVRFQGERLADQ